jgi:hypothetical protein
VVLFLLRLANATFVTAAGSAIEHDFSASDFTWNIELELEHLLYKARDEYQNQTGC